MTLSLHDFRTAVCESGLLTSQQSLPRSNRACRPSGSCPKDGSELAKELVRLGLPDQIPVGQRPGWQKVDNLVYGEYVVLDKIGSGGMGQVFKVRAPPHEAASWP